MIEDHPDPGTDPLAGRDPHPRAQIDLWPLHDARQELLEEIVSQPGAGNTAAPSARRFRIPVGIAAAIALVVGGGWFVVSNDDNGNGDDQVVASSDSPPDVTDGTDGSTDGATDPGTEATDQPSEQALPTRIPVREIRKGDVLGPQQCREVRRGVLVHGPRGKPRDITLEELEKTMEGLRYVVVQRGKEARSRWYLEVHAGTRLIGVDNECTVVSVRRVPNLTER